MSSPQLHCVHVIPGRVPSVVITGRNLWMGSEWADAGRHAIAINGVGGRPDRMLSSSGLSPNRGLSVVQRAWFPLGLASQSQATLTYTRNDGATDEIRFAIPMTAPRWQWVENGPRVMVDEPIVVAPGATLDLGGKTIIPSDKFRGQSVIRYGRGSVIQNGRVCISEDGPDESVLRSALAPAQDTLPVAPSYGVRIQGMEILDSRHRGMGIFLSSSECCWIANCRISAWECVKQDPNDTQLRNIYWRNEFTSPRGVEDGQVGSIGGGENLILGNTWHNIDRGPTISCWGQPLARSTWFRNVQRNTGMTLGASEGLLYESALSWQGQAVVTGNRIRFNSVSGQWPVTRCRIGYVAMAEPASWATITRHYSEGAQWVVETDRPLGDGSRWVGCGNAAVQNNFVHNRFQDGKVGVYLFGAQADNYFAGNQFVRLRGGIASLSRKLEHEWSLKLPYTLNDNRFFSVQENEVTMPDGRSWPPEF